MKKIYLLIPLILFFYSLYSNNADLKSLEDQLPNLKGEKKGKVFLELIDKYYDIDFKKTIEFSDKSEKIIPELKDSVLKIDLYKWRALVLRYKDKPQQSLDYAKKGLKIAEKINNIDKISESMIEIGRSLAVLNKFQMALDMYNKASEKNKKNNNQLLLGKINYYKGSVYYSQSENITAKKFYEKALSIFKKINNREREAYTLRAIGSVYNAQSDYSKALEYYIESIKFFKDGKNKSTYAAILNDIGIIYDNLGNSKKALELYLRSKKIAEKEKDTSLISSLLNNIGTIYQDMGELEKSLSFYKQALEYEKKANYQLGIAIDLYNIGSIFIEMNQLTKAEKHIMESIKISRKIKDRTGIVMSLTVLAQIYTYKNKFKIALDYLKQAEKETKIIGSKELIRSIYKEYSSVYTASRDYPKSIKYYNKSEKLRKEILNIKSAKRIAEMRTRFETEKKELEIKNLKHQQVLKNAEIQKKEFQKNLVIIGLLIGFVIIILLIRQFRLKIKSNKLIKAKNSELQKAYKKLEQVAATDPLTKLSNRRDVLRKIEYELDKFKRYKRVFTIIIGDIDDFKHINDNFGHNTGDFILISISDILRNNVRKQDTVSRWGGEEFLIFMPETDLAGGITLAEKIRKKIMDHEIKYKENTFKITITFGVGEFREGMELDQCIKFADQALYLGKKDGKNKVVPFKHKI